MIKSAKGEERKEEIENKDSGLSTNVMIMGEPGTGKSTSMINLDPKSSFLIQTLNKSLPFPKKKGGLGDTKFVSDKFDEIGNKLLEISNDKKEIKTIIIDDFQYMMCNEFIQRSSEKGYDKFNEIARKTWDVLYKSTQLRDDLVIVFLTHSEEDEGRTKAMTVGKMMDKFIKLEGMFTIVLESARTKDGYFFLTQNNGRNTAKSPMGMFKDELIKNDLNTVIEAIRNY